MSLYDIYCKTHAVAEEAENKRKEEVMLEFYSDKVTHKLDERRDNHESLYPLTCLIESHRIFTIYDFSQFLRNNGFTESTFKIIDGQTIVFYTPGQAPEDPCSYGGTQK